MRHRAALVFLTVLLVAGPVSGMQIVTFDGLSGWNGDPFNSIVEGSYTVTSTQGAWREGHASGNPVPSIFSSADVAQITVVGGPDFFFSSFETNDGGIQSGISTASYSIEGFLDGVSVLLGGGVVSPQYQTNLSPDDGQLLDRLVIAINRGSTSSYNIENIHLVPIPEPATATLCLLGIAALGLGRRLGLGLDRGLVRGGS